MRYFISFFCLQLALVLSWQTLLAQSPVRINFGSDKTCGEFQQAIKTTGNIAPGPGVIVSGSDVLRFAPSSNVPAAGMAECMYSSEIYAGGNSDLTLTFCDLGAFEPHTLNLHFAEIYHGLTGPGSRQFDIEVQGSTVASNVDIWAEANTLNNGNGGHNFPVDKLFNAVTDVNGCIVVILKDIGINNPKINGISIDQGFTTLPVSFQSFWAETDAKNRVSLRWETASELNNYGFEVEYSRDAVIYESAGFVPGVGNSQSLHSYGFEMGSLAAGQYSFRLKQIDFDGKFAYSPTIEIALDQPHSFQVSSIFPNPSASVATLEVNVDRAQTIDMQLLNGQGQLVRHWANQPVLPGEVNRLQIYTRDLPNGNYLVKVQGAGVRISRKLLILH